MSVEIVTYKSDKESLDKINGLIEGQRCKLERYSGNEHAKLYIWRGDNQSDCIIYKNDVFVFYTETNVLIILNEEGVRYKFLLEKIQPKPLKTKTFTTISINTWRGETLIKDTPYTKGDIFPFSEENRNKIINDLMFAGYNVMLMAQDENLSILSNKGRFTQA